MKNVGRISDREKVIEALKRYVDAPNLAGVENYGAKIVDMPAPLIADAIALLKAQEAKPPVVKENSYGWKFYYCPSCGKEFYQNNKFGFCEKCGQAVKWE